MDKVICVGKNYLKHAQELGDAVPEEPLYFLKPPSVIRAIYENGEEVKIPKGVDHELELVLRVAKSNGKVTFAQYTLGLDLTLREMQSRLKKAGQPWEKAKVFHNSAIHGQWHPFNSMNDVLEMSFELSVNGKVRQKATGMDMRWKPEWLLEDLQRWLPLMDGDILFTGTPEGVGPLADGDEVEVVGGNVRYAFRCKVGG